MANDNQEHSSTFDNFRIAWVLEKRHLVTHLGFFHHTTPYFCELQKKQEFEVQHLIGSFSENLTHWPATDDDDNGPIMLRNYYLRPVRWKAMFWYVMDTSFISIAWQLQQIVFFSVRSLSSFKSQLMKMIKVFLNKTKLSNTIKTAIRKPPLKFQHLYFYGCRTSTHFKPL